MLHIETPLVPSPHMSKLADRPVYLKLENLQVPGSFKIRGIGLTCQEAQKSGFTKLVGSSGGNAGLAMAYAANQLEMPLTLFIPKSTPQMMVDLIQAQEVEVRIIGENWNQANEAAQEFLKSNQDAFFVHPYDQESTWRGHASMVPEIKSQLQSLGVKNLPEAIITCVGGGGLAVGLLKGMQDCDWNTKVPLIAMETEGSNCFHEALKAKKIVNLESINSIAKSLGALSVSEELLKMALSQDFKVQSHIVSDRDALSACLDFAKYHRMLVEPACGAALSAVFNQSDNTLPKNGSGPIIMVVCGGNIASLELFDGWKKQLNI